MGIVKTMKRLNVLPAFLGGSGSSLSPPNKRSDTNFRDPAQWLINLVKGNSRIGKNVNTTTALGLTTVYRCVRIISDTISTLQFNLYRTDGRTKELAENHSLWNLIHSEPHPLFTQQEFWEYMISSMYLHGKGMALIIRNASGVIIRLTPIPPSDAKPLKGSSDQSETPEYYQVKGYDTPFHVDDLIIIRNYLGMSSISLHAETIGEALAQRDYGADFYGSGGNVTSILSSAAPLNDAQKKSLAESWNAAPKDGKNHQTKVLPFGVDYKRITVSPQEAQFIEGKKLSTEDICRIFGVPKFLVYTDSDTTYSNTEQQMLSFVTTTIRAEVKKIEQQIHKKLIRGESSLKMKINIDSLLRGDVATRSKFYTDLRRIGALSPNDIRNLEGWNPTEGGDNYFVQFNELPIQYSDEYAKSVIDGKSSANTSKTKGDE